jgi:hypothetical protein
MRLLCWLCVLLFAPIAFAQVAAPTKPNSTVTSPDNAALKQMFLDDQHDRGNDPFPTFDDHGNRMPTKQWAIEPDATLAKHDADRRARVHKMLDEGQVQSGQDYWFAAMIYQHGEEPNDYLMAHVLATAAAIKGNRNGLWLAAASLDRYLMSVKQKQIYGTQFALDKKGPWTQSDYDKDLLSDNLRALSCVTPYAQQQKQIKAAQDGQTLDANTGLMSCIMSDR